MCVLRNTGQDDGWGAASVTVRCVSGLCDRRQWPAWESLTVTEAAFSPGHCPLMGMSQLAAKPDHRTPEEDVLGDLHVSFLIVEELPRKSYSEEKCVYWLPFSSNLLKTFLSSSRG